MQPVSLPQVDSRHASSSSTFIPSIIGFDGLDPEVAEASLAVLAEANIDEEVAELVLGFEVRGRFLGGPRIDTAGQERGTVPAAEGAGAFGLVV